MESARIPGMTVAVIEEGEIVRTDLLGVANAETGEPVTAHTLFEAASLSKPVFATAVLRMAERGEIDLDQPLHELLPNVRIVGGISQVPMPGIELKFLFLDKRGAHFHCWNIHQLFLRVPGHRVPIVATDA